MKRIAHILMIIASGILPFSKSVFAEPCPHRIGEESQIALLVDEESGNVATVSLELQLTKQLKRTLICDNLGLQSNLSFKQIIDNNTKYHYSNHLFVQQPSRLDSVSKTYAESDSLKLKSTEMALLMALFPGIIAHGSGHFYAGEKKVGTVLLGTGIVGTGLLAYGVLSEFAEEMGGSEKTQTSELLTAVGVILFLGSWAYDIIGAPIAVQKRNQEMQQKSKVSLKTVKRADGWKLILVKHF